MSQQSMGLSKHEKRAKRPRLPKTASETLSIPEAGKHYFGLSRNGSYAAAKRGEILTMDVGRLKRVPKRAMDRKLDRIGDAIDLPSAPAK